MSVLSDVKKTAQSDWHRADILAGLRKKGWTLRSLADEGGVSYSTLKSALDKSYPKMERLIASAIGVAPEVIWAGRTAERIERNRRPTLTNKF
ncbi:putative transcriptional regulator, Nlp [Actinobacillus lignieresii]|uniref:helix-turn-helix domain-containing protein n=1 Tax=Actinobacillus TaxID=713 RepID=UPI00036C9586|nr:MULTISPECIES: helix-turn-helix domain-containing protein [Actinobacillus]VEB25733.1 putative transcriptional regulator, Nlp [Actinobacillus lignieresii]